MGVVALSSLRRRVEASGLRMETRMVNGGSSSAHEVFDFVASNGRTLFSVDVDDLYDAEGNRFFRDVS